MKMTDLYEKETACSTHFYMRGFALRLALRQRHKRTRKWPINKTTCTHLRLVASCVLYIHFQVTVEIYFKTAIRIECVRLTSSNSIIQNKRATKGFILIRHKRYQIYPCLQLSSSIASLVWKPAHFEFRSYGGA